MEVLSSQILFLSAFQESNRRIMGREERGRKVFLTTTVIMNFHSNMGMKTEIKSTDFIVLEDIRGTGSNQTTDTSIHSTTIKRSFYRVTEVRHNLLTQVLSFILI